MLELAVLPSCLSSFFLGAVTNYPQFESDTLNSVRLMVSILPSVDSPAAPSLRCSSGHPE